MQNTNLPITQRDQLNSNLVYYNCMGIIGRATGGTPDSPGVTNLDLKLTDDHFLTGGNMRVKGQTFGDFAHMQVVDKDLMLKDLQVPGQPPGVTYSMIPGYPVLRQFVTNYYVADDSSRQFDFDLSYLALVRAGLYLRLVYNAIGTIGPQVIVNFYIHKLVVGSV